MRAIKCLLLSFWFFVSLAFAGDMEYKGRSFTVRISAEQCQNLLFVVTLAQAGEEFGLAVVTVNGTGRKIEACWTIVDEKVILIDEDGDLGFILLSDFTAAPGI